MKDVEFDPVTGLPLRLTPEEARTREDVGPLEREAQFDPVTGLAIAVDPTVARARKAARQAVLVTTTQQVEGREIQAYLGIVFGEAIVGANVFSDLAASARDVVGGRSASYEAKLGTARTVVIDEMIDQAVHREANGIVGVRLDYESMRSSMLMVAAQGTAVRLATPS